MWVGNLLDLLLKMELDFGKLIFLGFEFKLVLFFNLFKFLLVDATIDREVESVHNHWVGRFLFLELVLAFFKLKF